MHLEQKWALVTGGNTGIGEQVALELVAKGAHVVIVARDRDRAQAVTARHPDRMTFIQADLSLPDEQDRVVREVTQRFPQLAILVNNAGVQVNMPAVSIGSGDQMTRFRSEIAINLTAPVALSFGLMPLLAGQPEAAIVNVSSGLAVAPKRTAPVYCASKAGLRAFSRALRYRCEDAAPEIRVIDVIMAFVDTGMTRDRGGRKMSARASAKAIVAGIEGQRREVWVGKTRLLRIVGHLFPGLAYRLMRNG